MRRYTLEELALASTYAADADLATLARRVAEKTFVAGSMSFGDWKRSHLAGEHPEAVAAALEHAVAEAEEQSRITEANRDIARGLNGRLFDTHRVEFDEAAQVLIVRGPWHEKLHGAIKRADGWYESKPSGVNECTWRFALDVAPKVESLLKRVLVKPAEKARAERTRAEGEETEAIRQAPSLGGLHGVVQVFDGLTRYEIRLPYAPGQAWFEDFKARLKAAGAKWDSAGSVWQISKAQHALVRELLATAPRPVPTPSPEPARKTVETAAKRPTPATLPEGHIRLYFHYGNIHEQPKDQFFRHKDGLIYQIVSEKEGIDFDGEVDLTLICRPATAEETRVFIENEVDQAQAAADRAILRRVSAGKGIDGSVGSDTIEWVSRDDANPYGDTALGLAWTETGVWTLVVRERFSDGRTLDRHFPIDEADVEPIRRTGRRETTARNIDRLTALSAEGAEA